MCGRNSKSLYLYSRKKTMGYDRRLYLHKLEGFLKIYLCRAVMLGPQWNVWNLSVVLSTSSLLQVAGSSPYVFVSFSITAPVMQLFPSW